MIVPILAWRALGSRRVVLGTAFAAGLVLALVVSAHPVRHAAPIAIVSAASAAQTLRVQAPAEPDKKPAEAGRESPGASVDAEITIGNQGVIIKRRSGERDADVVVDGHEFDSFEQFVEQAPWLAGLVFMVTALVFLVPLLIIILVIWYKMRSNRLRNETMLKLAERGVVPPAAAIDAVGTMPSGAALAGAPATAPLYEQARQVGRRAAWSDLRKGVILGGIGLGLALWGMLDDGTPNGLGLVLLFVGIGYGVLWHFEQRQLGGTGRDQPTGPKGGS